MINEDQSSDANQDFLTETCGMQKMLICAAEKVLLMEEKEHIRADVTEGRKTNVWGSLMQEVYPSVGQKVLDHKYQSRG